MNRANELQQLEQNHRKRELEQEKRVWGGEAERRQRMLVEEDHP